ncbi:MobA/MobL family protein, partial [Coprococcus sp. AF99-45]
MSKNGKEEHKMPCPHNEISIVQRSHRQSAVAAAAYQSGEKLFCEYDQEVKHYPEKRGIVHNEILLPANAPLEYTDRNTLWNAAEAVEKQ